MQWMSDRILIIKNQIQNKILEKMLKKNAK